MQAIAWGQGKVGLAEGGEENWELEDGRGLHPVSPSPCLYPLVLPLRTPAFFVILQMRWKVTSHTCLVFIP